jgi:hypothetical protein
MDTVRELMVAQNANQKFAQMLILQLQLILLVLPIK